MHARDGDAPGIAMEEGSARRPSSPRAVIGRCARRAFLSLAVGAVASMAAGCSTLFNPYLTPISNPGCGTTASTDASSGTPIEPSSCTPAQTFVATLSAVERAQKEAHDSYVQRGEANTVTSALAFPVASYLLYRGTLASTADERNHLLSAGLIAGSVYEARSALLSGSPEALYQLAEARLLCVADEGAAYRTAVPDPKVACDTTLTAMMAAADSLSDGTGSASAAQIATGADVASKARAAQSSYLTADNDLFSASDAMRKSANRIISDINFQLKTPGITPMMATPLMNSQVSGLVAAPTLPTSTEKDFDTVYLDKVNRASALVNTFAKNCVRVRPVSTAGFDACATYSPTAGPAPSITTDLPGNAKTLKFGDTLSVMATSTPTGQPWANYSGNSASAEAALGPIQIKTLSPTQSQITIAYKTAVAAETVVNIAISSTTGGAGSTVLTLTLVPKAP
jgi:hypothetical protein